MLLFELAQVGKYLLLAGVASAENTFLMVIGDSRLWEKERQIRNGENSRLSFLITRLTYNIYAISQNVHFKQPV